MPKSPRKTPALAIAGHANGDDDIQLLFESLKTQWERDMEGVSNYAHITAHPAYLRIIGQGSAILPAIFHDLDAGGGPWFVALSAITGANPVKSKHRNNTTLMRRDWMQWGKSHGYA